MARIALTVWQGRIAPLFDVAGTLLLAELSGDSVTERRETALPGNSGPLERVSFLTGHGVSVLICGAISRPVHRILADSGVEVISFVSGEVEEVLQAYLAGNLEGDDFCMPGCGGGMRRGCGGGTGFSRRRRGRSSCHGRKEV